MLKENLLQTFLKHILLIICFACWGSVSNYAQTYEWAKSMGGSGADVGQGIAVDGSGNVYVTGYFAGVAYFGSGTGRDSLESAGGNSDAFIAKYDAHGNYLWAISMGGSHNDEGYAVAVDDSGNVYVTGFFRETADFDPGTGTAWLTSMGNSDIFVAKYDSSGNYLWAIGMGAVQGDIGYGLAVDGNGNVYVTGMFRRTVDFDPGSGIAMRSAAGGASNRFPDIFVAKYDPSGNYLWAISMGGREEDIGFGLAVDDSGNVYVTGSFMSGITQDSVDFDPGPGIAILTSVGSADVFVAKYDSSGDYLWAKSMGGSNGERGLGIALDASYNVYVRGVFTGSADFDPGAGIATLNSVGGSADVFVAKYDPNGNYLWANSMGGPTDDFYYFGGAIAVDRSANVYVGGGFRGTADFDRVSGAATLTAAGGLNAMDIFVAKYDPKGNYLWAKRMGGDGHDESFSIAIDGAGNAYVTGNFGPAADFDPGTGTATLTPVEDGSLPYVLSDAFVVKLSCSDTTSSYFTISVPCGESHTLNDSMYTATGIYTQVFPNVAGCDSTVTLDLTVLPLAEPVITTDSFTLGVTATYFTYQWLLNGELIAGSNGSTFTVTENGNYQVVVTNEYGCSDTSDVYVVDNVSIDGVSVATGLIQVYPNPANSLLYINSPLAVHAHISCIDGRNILSAKHTKVIDVSSFAEGIYLLRITDSEGRLITVEKVVRQ